MPGGPESLAQRRERLIAQIHRQRLQGRAELQALAQRARPAGDFAARLARDLAAHLVIAALRRGLQALRRGLGAKR